MFLSEFPLVGGLKSGFFLKEKQLNNSGTTNSKNSENDGLEDNLKTS